MKNWPMRKICRIRDCNREIPAYKDFCHSHWTMIPWLLKDWLIRVYVIGQHDEILPGQPVYLPSPDWQRALRESTLAVEEQLRDQRPRLHE